MKPLRHVFPLITIVLSILLFVATTGCDLIFPFEAQVDPDSGKQYSCGIDILNCKKTLNPPQITVDTPPQQDDCFAPKDNFQVNEKAYCDKSWRIESIGYPKLKGAWRVITRLKDNNDTVAEYLRFHWKQDIAGLFIAYDSRASKKPNWLHPPAYKRVEDANGKPFYITIAVPNQSKKVDLEIFENRNLPKKNMPISLPGNFSGGPSGWPASFDTADAVTYMVVIKPKTTIDCSNPAVYQSLNPVEHIGCFASEEEASEAAKQICEEEIAKQMLTEHTCGPPKCGETQVCAKQSTVSIHTGFTMRPWTFLRHSEIEFKPASYKSQATITVWRKKYQKNTTGHLHFEYVLDGIDRMTGMNINSMVLKVDPFDTDGGKFSDIVVSLLGPVKATCVDPLLPPPATPCNTYRIAKKTLIAEESATVDSEKVIFISQNAYPVDIKIDHATRTFKITGGISTRTTINNKDANITTDIDLTGHFLNFAPKASAVESTKHVECTYGRDFVAGNKSKIMLTGSGSFEVYNDPIPNSAYTWYDDFGLATEKKLGSGKLLTVVPHTLSWGVHPITLALRDSSGVVSTYTFDLDVQDHLTPDLYVPPDRFVLASHSGPVKVSLGQVWAKDLCSREVEITNDAPANGMFPTGVTTVTWKADDGRGNLTEDIQHVYVFLPLDSYDPVTMIGRLVIMANTLNQAIPKALATVEACTLREPCGADFSNLLEVIDQTTAHLRKVQLPKESERTRNGIIDSFSLARAGLVKSQRLVEEYKRLEKSWDELQNAARKSMGSSVRSMNEATGLLERLKQQVEKKR